MVIRETLTQYNGAGKVANAGCLGRVAVTLLILLIACASAFAQVAYIKQRVGKRVVVLIVKRETAERRRQNRLTEADRKDLQEAQDWALGVGQTRKADCIGHDTPHDIPRWVRCPVQNITKP